MHIKYLLTGVFIGYVLCMLTGYLLILYDERKEKKKRRLNGNTIYRNNNILFDFSDRKEEVNVYTKRFDLNSNRVCFMSYYGIYVFKI